MERIDQDFMPNKDSAKVKFVGIVSNRALETTFGFEGHDTTVESDLHNGCVLVTTADGDAACYHVDVHGKVTKSSADEMLSEFAPEMDDVLQTVQMANKGLFIGSREYSDAMKALEKALNCCSRQISRIDLYGEAKAAELNAALRGRRANKAEIMHSTKASLV